MHGERGCYDRDTHTQTDVTVLDLEEYLSARIEFFPSGGRCSGSVIPGWGWGAGG